MSREHWYNSLRERLHEVLGETPHADIARMTGHPDGSIRRYMTTGRPSPDFLAAICRVYGINANWLLLGVGPKYGTRLAAIARDLVDWRRVVAAANAAIEEEVILASDEIGEPAETTAGGASRRGEEYGRQ